MLTAAYYFLLVYLYNLLRFSFSFRLPSGKFISRDCSTSAGGIGVDFSPDTQKIQQRNDRIFRVKNISCSRSYLLQVYAKYSRPCGTTEKYSENVSCKYLRDIFNVIFFKYA